MDQKQLNIDNGNLTTDSHLDQPAPEWYSQPEIARDNTVKRSPWKTAGIVIGIILAVCGFVFIGLLVLFALAMSSYGSNK